MKINKSISLVDREPRLASRVDILAVVRADAPEERLAKVEVVQADVEERALVALVGDRYVGARICSQDRHLIFGIEN